MPPKLKGHTLSLCFPTAANLATFASSLTEAQEALMCTESATPPGQPPPDPGTTPPNQPPTARLALVEGRYVTDPFKVSTAGTLDPDGSLALGTLNWGDGTQILTWNGVPDDVYEHDYSVAGTYAVTLTVVDNLGLGQSTVLQLAVLVEPAVEPPPPPPPPPPNPPPLAPPTVTLAVSGGTLASTRWYFTATCTGNIASGTINYGDGTIEPFTGPPLGVFSHAYVDAGPYTVTVAVLDTNTLTAQDSEPITVGAPPPPPDVPPLIALTAVSGQFAGDSFVFSTEGTADPALQDLASGSINWGDGSAVQTWGAGLVPPTLSHVYTVAATRTITFQVLAQNGLAASLSRPVTVQAVPATNQPPTASLSRVSGVYVGDLYTLALNASDPEGVLGLWTLNWGDGTTLQSGTGTPPGTRTHTYTGAGTYTATFTVTDAGGLTRTVTTALTVLTPVVVPPPTGGANAYFDSLVLHPGFVKSVSYRNPAQLVARSLGGFAQRTAPYYVTYAPGTDTNPQAQDAAKVVVPVWDATVYALETAISAGATAITASFFGNTGWNHHSIKFLDTGEIVDIPAQSLNAATGTLSNLVRGQRGTTAVGHAAGAQFLRNVNSLPNQVRVPIGSPNGHVHLITWDHYYTDACVLRPVPGKTFQLTSRGIWLEPGVSAAGRTCDNNAINKAITAPGFLPGVDVGSWSTRSYNATGGGTPYSATPIPGQSGPGIVNSNPLGPCTPFIIKPGRWIRTWIQIDQRATDYDYMSQWIATAVTGVVQVHSNLPLALRIEEHQITEHYIEVNTSDDSLPLNLVDLVMYVKNLAILRDVSAAPLLVTTGL